MKTEALKWCLNKVGYDAPDTCDTEAAQRSSAAWSELAVLENHGRESEANANARTPSYDGKPWEQEWREGSGDEHHLAVYDSDGKCVVYCPEPSERKVISAAPDMARALLANRAACIFTGSFDDRCPEDVSKCSACVCEAALRKAGVLP